MLTLRLTLDVNYKLNGETVTEMAENLRQMVHRAMGDGHITGETPAEVVTHFVKVERIQNVP